MIEKIIPMPSHITKTVADFREFYTETSPDSWPRINLHSLGKKWTFQEYVKIRERLLYCFKSVGYEPEIRNLICTPPPSEKMSFGFTMESIENDVKINEQNQKHWEKTRKTLSFIDEFQFSVNKYIQCQVFPKGTDSYVRTAWCYFVKESPTVLHIGFYPDKKLTNEIIINEFCKPSFRYRLSGE